MFCITEDSQEDYHWNDL